MGKSVIGSVTEQMMGIFASNLQTMLAEPDAAPRSPTEGAASAAGPAPVATAPPPTTAARAAVAAAGTETPSPAPPPTPTSSLDAFSLAKGIAAGQLSSPGKVAGLLAAVAVLAYWAGRRSAFRMLRLCGRL
jgi:hypothetical protein